MRRGPFKVRPLQEYHRPASSGWRGAAAAPLAELLQALAPPLEYLAADGFRRSIRPALPLGALAERVARARADGRPACRRCSPSSAEHPRGAPRRRGRDARGAAPARPRAPARSLRGRPRRPRTWTDVSRRRAARSAERSRRSATRVDDDRAASARSAPRSWHASASTPSRTSSTTCRSATRTAARCCRSRALRIGEEATADRHGRRAYGRRASGAAAGPCSRCWLRGRRRRCSSSSGSTRSPSSARASARDSACVVHGRVDPPLGRARAASCIPEIEVLDADEDTSRARARSSPSTRSRRRCRSAPCGGSCRPPSRSFADRVPSGLPAAVAARQRLARSRRARCAACTTPHARRRTSSGSNARDSLAHRSLIFDELFFLQLGLALRRSDRGARAGDGVSGLDAPRARAARRAAVPADGRAGARVHGDRRRPRRAAPDAAPPAGRRRQRQDAGGAAWPRSA